MSIDQQRERNRAVWDDIAAGWQRHQDYLWRVTRRVGEWMVDKLDPREGQTILDVAAGPGETGFVAARLVGSNGRLICTDFSPAMVDVARQRAADLGLDNVDFAVMDAENMDLPDDHVDGILCRWGFMLMLDPDAAVSECKRVLRDGGRLVFSVWGGPEKNPWITVMGMVMIQQGFVPEGDPFGPGGMFSLADHDRIRSMLERPGFSQIDIEEMDVVWSYGSFDQLWEFVTSVAGALASLIKDLSEEDVARIREAAREAVEVYRTDSGYDIPGVTINVVAT